MAWLGTFEIKRYIAICESKINDRDQLMTMLFSGFISEVNVDIPEDARDVYPFNIPLFKDFKSIALHPKVNFFIGDNGMGKST